MNLTVSRLCAAMPGHAKLLTEVLGDLAADTPISAAKLQEIHDRFDAQHLASPLLDALLDQYAASAGAAASRPDAEAAPAPPALPWGELCAGVREPRGLAQDAWAEQASEAMQRLSTAEDGRLEQLSGWARVLIDALPWEADISLAGMRDLGLNRDFSAMLAFEQLLRRFPQEVEQVMGSAKGWDQVFALGRPLLDVHTPVQAGGSDPRPDDTWSVSIGLNGHVFNVEMHGRDRFGPQRQFTSITYGSALEGYTDGFLELLQRQAGSSRHPSWANRYFSWLRAEATRILIARKVHATGKALLCPASGAPPWDVERRLSFPWSGAGQLEMRVHRIEASAVQLILEEPYAGFSLAQEGKTWSLQLQGSDEKLPLARVAALGALRAALDAYESPLGNLSRLGITHGGTLLDALRRAVDAELARRKEIEARAEQVLQRLAGGEGEG